ncbi:MAG: hypothetical protein P4M13_06265 [Alphaproteobacteria bacterium]|nr:hypothetical protein [Alphaproteobacteria bacterium]
MLHLRQDRGELKDGIEFLGIPNAPFQSLRPSGDISGLSAERSFFVLPKSETVIAEREICRQRSRAPQEAVSFAPAFVPPLPRATSPLKQPRKYFSRMTGQFENHVSEVMNQFWNYICTYEFWLGFAFGLVTRIMTQFAILSAFPSRQANATIPSFLACAAAGMIAAIVTYLVRTGYRNAKLQQGGAKGTYWGRHLFEYALFGLSGGVLGGCVTNAGAIMARSGNFAIGAALGIAIGIYRATGKGARVRQANMDWGNLAFQSVLFGAVGGVLGVVSADLLSSHVSVAASVPVGGAGSVVYLQPSDAHAQGYYYGNPCDTCGAPPPPPVLVQPQPIYIQPAPVVVQEVVHPVQLHHIAHHHVHHHKAACAPPPAEAYHYKLCYPAKHVKHIRHHVHHVHHKAPPPVVEQVIIQPATLPPPVVVQPHVVPLSQPHYNPCDMGRCADPRCGDTSQIYIKEQFRSARYVERVNFNSSGEAKSVTLEPSDIPASKPYYEVWHDHGVASNAAQNASVASNSATDATKVSLVVPLADRTLALAGAKSVSA